MKLTKREASEKEKAPGAIYKRLEGGEKKKDEATSEEAAERRTQQQCILSGGVYLRHRLRKSSFSLVKTDFPENTSFHQSGQKQRILATSKTMQNSFSLELNVSEERGTQPASEATRRP